MATVVTGGAVETIGVDVVTDEGLCTREPVVVLEDVVEGLVVDITGARKSQPHATLVSRHIHRPGSQNPAGPVSDWQKLSPTGPGQAAHTFAIVMNAVKLFNNSSM